MRLSMREGWRPNGTIMRHNLKYPSDFSLRNRKIATYGRPRALHQETRRLMLFRFASHGLDC